MAAPDTNASFESHVQTYNKILHQNNLRRISLMSDADKQAYQLKFGLNNCTDDTILIHMTKWDRLGGHKSQLFERIASGRNPLEFDPPKTYGQAWYELFDVPSAHIVNVDNMRPTRRHNSREIVKYIISINDCTWEILSASIDLDMLFDLDKSIKKDKSNFDYATLNDIMGPGKMTMTVKYGLCPFHFDLCSLGMRDRSSTDHLSLFSSSNWQLKRKL